MDIFKGTTTQQKLLYLSLLLVFACQNPIANEIPYLFYRSDLECKIDGEWKACKEQELCFNEYEYKFVGSDIKSISMSFGLICEKKLLEATIIFLGPFAQMLAFFVSIFYEIPKSKKFGVILKMLLIEGFSLVSIPLFSESLFFIVVIYFIWNFIWAFFFSQYMQYIEDNFPKKLFLKAPVFMNILWPIAGLIFVTLTFSHGDYQYHCVYMVGMPILLTTFLFYILSKSSQREQNIIEENVKPINQKLLQNNITQQEQTYINNGQQAKEKEEQLQAEIKQESFIKDLIEKFKELLNDKVCLKNMFIYIGCWVIQMLCMTATFIAFNSIGGNMQSNVFQSILFELAGSFIAMYLMQKYKCLTILYYNFIVVGFSLSFVILNDSGFVQILIINIIKVSNKITFAALMLALNYVIPKRFMQLTFSITNIISIASNSILPFYKYYMDLIEINFFFGLGIASFISVILIRQITIVNDPEQEEQKDIELNSQDDFEVKKKSLQRFSNNFIEIDKNVVKA